MMRRSERQAVQRQSYFIWQILKHCYSWKTMTIFSVDLSTSTPTPYTSFTFQPSTLDHVYHVTTSKHQSDLYRIKATLRANEF